MVSFFSAHLPALQIVIADETEAFLFSFFRKNLQHPLQLGGGPFMQQLFCLAAAVLVQRRLIRIPVFHISL